MNTLHLYGNIVDVFEGKTDPSSLTAENAGVSPSLRFGLGVSSFRDDLANIGDAVYFDGRYFIRSTDEGQRRDPRKGKFKEGRAPDYRTVYSLGITEHPLEMAQAEFLHDEACPSGFTVENLLSRIIGPARSLGETPRTFGFLGLLDYENIHSTSLAVPPIHGENIIPLMEKYARPSDPVPGRSGAVMGFVRHRTDAKDDADARVLGQRLFFDNPKDNEEGFKAVSADDDLIRGPHWISHTHGVRLPAGRSTLPSESALFRKMAYDSSFRRTTIDQALARDDFEDCGHVIPKSTLRRYFFIVFPIHSIESFH